ncbi:MAG: class I SAM-dependent methyltransferase [Acidobacteriota bacterium]
MTRFRSFAGRAVMTRRQHVGSRAGAMLVALSVLLPGLMGCESEVGEPPAAHAAAAPLDPSILADASRSDDDRKRDEGFKPLEVYGFFGVHAGQTVADLWPGRGYNTQILSGAVGPDGEVLAVLGPIYSRPRYVERIRGYINDRIEEGHLTNVKLVTALADLADDSVDVMITVRNYHDLGEAEDRVAVLPELLRALKPGGILGVVDAVTPHEGRDEEHHRINEELVVKEITGAGFELEARSPLLENPDDTYDFDGREDDAPIHRYFIHRFVHKYRKPLT